LSNLDAQLRDEMRSEIKRLHQELGTTMIYVTHDQIEAMTLADKIVLLREGRIEQAGPPLDLYERPATRFVAGFLGSPQMNFIPAQLAQSGGGWAVKVGDGTSLALPRARDGLADGRKVVLGLRPQHVTRANGSGRPGHQRLGVTVELVQPTGSRAYITFPLGGVPTVAELEPHDVQRPGERIDVDVDMNRAVLIDPETNRVI
jgi:multiple sugar transport system ATP-binding protein